MEDLPKELVISILLRLPAEDLRRCKSVCKSLYAIITSRSFIEKSFYPNNIIRYSFMDSMSSKDRVVKVVGCCNGVTIDALSVRANKRMQRWRNVFVVGMDEEYGEHVMSFDISNEEHVIRFCNSPSLASHHPIPVHKPVELMAYTIVPLQ
ncbi:hypothetical protein FEM48_Zijuj02G0185800 [Ziziphus jujuba var. spinosa]|uniref:F-box domain-containing protein n=1 Tax=Ziziphus jujuba var. spinosa TaxID=714518 RepID=A0A978VXA8_ZIZJJ|nr:hypothetical protein FEM48_Zijuj02G0185800 [Ziziphus jujuba var. spinosa]